MDRDLKPGDVISLDDLTRVCGYFTTIHDANNGYCCAHPKQDMRQDGHGCCFSFSCPIAHELSPDDDEDVKLAGFSESSQMSEGYWMQVHGQPRRVHVLISARRAVRTRRRATLPPPSSTAPR